MPILHVVHTYPFYTRNLKPGELIITLSDIKGTNSQLYIAEENTSDELTHYGCEPTPLLSRIGEIALTDMDEETLDKLKAARCKLTVNHTGPLELSDMNAAKILRLYAPLQSPTSVAGRALSPLKSTSRSLNMYHFMHHAKTEEPAVGEPLSPRFF